MDADGTGGNPSWIDPRGLEMKTRDEVAAMLPRHAPLSRSLCQAASLRFALGRRA